ncbi:MAG: PP2C family protein-serine/threonine phosphatase [Rhodothermales bacterium]
MNRLLAALKTHLSRSDALLFGAATLGLLLYVLLLPSQHPYSTATYVLGEEGAQEAAAAFLVKQGYSTDSLDAEAEFRANDELLDSLQASLGRPGALRLLRGAQREEVPVFYWDVTYKGADDEDQDDQGREGRYEDRDDRYEIKVTAEGTVWSFENDERGNPGGLPHVDRAALRSAIAAMQPGTVEPQADVGGLPDSALVERLVFRLSEAADSSVDAGARAAAERFLPKEPILLDAAAVEALAFYHLAQTSLPTTHFRADSAWTRSESGQGRTAHVRLVTSEPIHGQHAQADFEIGSTGALRSMEVEFNPYDNEDGPFHLAGQIAQGVTFAVLVLVLIVAFFRRLTRRLIDVKAALIDAGVLGVLFIAFLAFNMDSQMGPEEAPFWVQVAFWVFGFGVAGGGIALFTFLLSAAVDSLTRAVLPSKLRSASLLRQASFRNTFVGLALVRGVAVALVLLGLAAGLLLILPGAGVRVGNGGLMLSHTHRPIGFAATLFGWYTYLTVVLVLLGMGVFFYRLRKRPWMLVAATAVGMLLIQGTVVDLQPIGYNWAASALFGGVLGLAFWRYDFLTCFTGLFLAYVVWGLNEGWLIEGSPAGVDVVLAALFVAGVAVLGFVGVASGRSGREVKEYVPSYIEEMAQQERMEHELKLAQQVQMSFLPRKMPRVEGLDVAAMCLPALEVGGDYYDFVEVAPGKLAVAVGDVSGKGIQAAFYMTLAKGFVQTLSRAVNSPAEVLRRLNTLFCENVPRGTFISMIYGVLDVEARTFTFARAGHNPVILKRSPSQHPEIFQPAGMAIGLAPGPRFNDTIEEATIDLLPGDALVFYTDGFSEAMNRVKEQYGDDRLAQKVGNVGRRPASGILQLVSEDVHHFVQEAGRHDDMTMVVIKLEGPPAPAATDELPTEHEELAAVTA